jgi:hypothetical protein
MRPTDINASPVYTQRGYKLLGDRGEVYRYIQPVNAV